MRKYRDVRLGVRAKLLYYKVFQRKHFGNKNQKNSNTYEKNCLLRSINIQ